MFQRHQEVAVSGKGKRRVLAFEREARASIYRLRIGLALVGATVAYGTAGYLLLEHMSFINALYQTITTISTVGFTEVHELGPVGRAFTLTLILGGVGAWLYTLSALFEMLVSEQVGHWRQRQVMQKTIDKLDAHYIICGYGRIGRQVSSDFRESGLPFLVVDNDPDRCARLLERGIPFVEGDATLDDTLEEAGISRARGLIAALSADAANVMTIVSARGLNPRLHIVARAALAEAESKLRRAGADEVISPYEVGAHRMSLSVLRPAVSGFLNAVLYDPELQAEFTEIQIEPDSGLVGQTLTEAGMAHGRDVLPLAVLRQGRLTFSPPADMVLEALDTLIVVTPVITAKLKH